MPSFMAAIVDAKRDRGRQEWIANVRREGDTAEPAAPPVSTLESAWLTPERRVARGVLVAEPREVLQGLHVVRAAADADGHVNARQQRTVIGPPLLVEKAADALDDHVDSGRVRVIASVLGARA